MDGENGMFNHKILVKGERQPIHLVVVCQQITGCCMRISRAPDFQTISDKSADYTF